MTENSDNRNKTTRAYKKFLCAVLVNSAFVTPAQGMMKDWPDLFDQEKSRFDVPVGANILTHLDDRSLEKAKQVSKNWQQLVNHVHDSRYIHICEGKVPLFVALLKAVEGEP